MVGIEASGAVKVPVVDRYVTVLIRGPLVLMVSRSLPPALLRCPRSCPFAPVLSSARVAPVSCLFPREVDFTFSRLFSLRRLRGSGQRGARALGRAADEGPAGPSSVVSRSLPCALRLVPEPRHGSAGCGLAARIPRRHRRRLPPARRLKLHKAGAGRGERLRSTNPQRVPRHAPFNASIGGPPGDHVADRTRRHAGVLNVPAPPDTPEQTLMDGA